MAVQDSINSWATTVSIFGTSMIWCGLANPPNLFLYFTMRFAVAGPMPGKCSQSLLSSWFQSSFFGNGLSFLSLTRSSGGQFCAIWRKLQMVVFLLRISQCQQ